MNDSGHDVGRWGIARRFAAALLINVALLIVPGGVVCAAEVAGVRVAPTARVGGVDLVLNGAGLRRFLFVDVYVIGMYFVERTGSARVAIDAPGPKRISLIFTREVTAQSLIDALFEGIRDNSTEAEFNKLKGPADALSTIMRQLRVAKKGDIVALDYLPGAGVGVVMNGQLIGSPVPNPDLYRALLKIWLGEVPINADLKRDLLLGPV